MLIEGLYKVPTALLCPNRDMISFPILLNEKLLQLLWSSKWGEKLLQPLKTGILFDTKTLLKLT